MKSCILIILSFIIAVTATGQSCKKKYKDKLESASKLIDCGANFTIEKLNNQSCIFKRYYPETKAITRLGTFKSDDLKVLHGLYEERWDDGTLVMSGMYANNQKVGFWRENINQTGYYINDLRHGEWKTFNKDSTVRKINNYINGILHGKQLAFDSLGEIEIEEEYFNGELISTTADTTVHLREVKPRFPGCENKGLTGEKLYDCSEEKMLQYIYKNLRYPRKSRQQNIQGLVIANFVIDKEGNITDITIPNGLAEDIKEEVVSVIYNMPQWIPGTLNGEPVDVPYKIPIKLKLE